MNEILSMREKRAKLWDATKAFVESRKDANAALQEGFIDAVMTEPAAGVTNAAFEHRVDPEDAKAKYQSWVDRHKPMRRSVRNEAPQAAPTEPRTSASDLQGRLDHLLSMENKHRNVFNIQGQPEFRSEVVV